MPSTNIPKIAKSQLEQMINRLTEAIRQGLQDKMAGTVVAQEIVEQLETLLTRHEKAVAEVEFQKRELLYDVEWLEQERMRGEKELEDCRNELIQALRNIQQNELRDNQILDASRAHWSIIEHHLLGQVRQLSQDIQTTNIRGICLEKRLIESTTRETHLRGRLREMERDLAASRVEASVTRSRIQLDVGEELLRRVGEESNNLREYFEDLINSMLCNENKDSVESVNAISSNDRPKQSVSDKQSKAFVHLLEELSSQKMAVRDLTAAVELYQSQYAALLEQYGQQNALVRTLEHQMRQIDQVYSQSENSPIAALAVAAPIDSDLSLLFSTLNLQDDQKSNTVSIGDSKQNMESDNSELDGFRNNPHDLNSDRSRSDKSDNYDNDGDSDNGGDDDNGDRSVENSRQIYPVQCIEKNQRVDKNQNEMNSGFYFKLSTQLHTRTLEVFDLQRQLAEQSTALSSSMNEVKQLSEWKRQAMHKEAQHEIETQRRLQGNKAWILNI